MFAYNGYGYNPPRPSKKGGGSWKRSGGGVSSDCFRPQMQVQVTAKRPQSTCHNEPAAGNINSPRRGTGTTGDSADRWAVPVYNNVGYSSLRPSRRGGESWRRSGGGVSSDCFRPKMATTQTKTKTPLDVYASKPAGINNPDPKPSKRGGKFCGI